MCGKPQIPMSSPPRRRLPEAAPLFAALQRPECYPHPVSRVQVLETHISWVLLTGQYAYKIKKPVNLGFADFSTLGLRRHYCEEEVRLNRRLAPEIYLEVVSIRGDARAPRVGGDGPVLDYAVKMVQFPQETLASRMLAAGTFGAAEADGLAARIAAFHAAAPAAAPGGRLGGPESVLAPALQNFDQMLALAAGSAEDGLLRTLRKWTEREFVARHDAFQRRQSGGAIRECHGDLHLGNIAVLDGRPVPFDCIEFNDELRWIDVASEAAFLVMDLEDRGRRDLAWRFVNRYLETTGDYGGVEVLRFYLAYRALVRAKVHLMRARQPQVRRDEKLRLEQAFRHYLGLAQAYAQPRGAALLVTHGLSGCGKSTATQTLLETIGAVRLRSDLERKRLHGIAPLAGSGSAPGTGIYTAEATAITYRSLGSAARSILAAGFPLIVDATFLHRAEREAFRAIAQAAGAPFLILDFHVPLDELRARVSQRLARGDDPSEASLEVLERQIAAREPLTPAEMASAVVVDGASLARADPWQAVRRKINITY
jgi:aminoglycoside phosphotransferase family enzyme/predicted kinase